MATQYLSRKIKKYKSSKRPAPPLLPEALLTGAEALLLLAGSNAIREMFPNAPHLERLAGVLWVHYLIADLAAREGRQ